jgi:Fe-S cluster biogenesis protein NfuA
MSISNDEQYQGDLEIVAKYLTAIEANILSSCLLSFGIRAEAGDVNLVQTDSLLTIALGGACVRVPMSKVAEAKEIIAARDRGELEIDESFNPNE